MKTAKKLVTALLACMIALSVLGSIVAFAGVATYDAKKESVCKEGKAALTVQYKETAPVMDGVVNEGEYFEIPYDAVKDYYSFYVGQEFEGSQENEHKKLANFAEKNMKVYACWDGQYFYFAMTSKTTKADYNCPENADSSYMYRYCCAQMGFAAPDAVEKDRYEIGLGASSTKPGDSYAYPAWGTRTFKTFKNGEQYCSKWDPDTGIATYEVKADIAEVTGAPASDGSQMRFTYLLAKSGAKSSDGTDRLQIQCSYGIADEKRADWYLMLTFEGLGKEVEVPTPAKSDDRENELPSFWGKTDFTDEDAAELFTTTENATVSYMKDADGTGFIRITATGNRPLAGGKKIPTGLNAAEAPYVAVKYRTSSEYGSKLGISFSSEIADASVPVSYDRSNSVKLGTDGEWHTVVYDLTDKSNWIMNLCFWPFLNADADVNGQTFDIQWIKYYSNEPEFDDVFDPSVTPAPTEEPAKDNKSESGSGLGTGAVIAIIAAAAVIVAFVVIVIVRKKK